jgi:oxygen-dependent protoporphyrinogen oxidase
VNNPSKSIAILGAGITGLTAAHRLVQQGHRVRVFESTGRTGGAIRTVHDDGWLIEEGPNSMLAGEPAVAALLAELGLESDVVPANSAARNRYIIRRGKAVAAPLSPPGLIASSLFSPGAKARVLAELLTRPRVRTTDLSVAEFGRAHFGQEIVDYGINPFVAGIHAGNPQKLSARYAFPKLWALEQKHGSLLRGQMAAARTRKQRKEKAGGIFSFRRGLQTLPDALAGRLPAGALQLNARIEALLPGSPWSLVWNDGTTARTESFDAVVAALPAYALAQLRFGTLGERPLTSLEGIEHPPVASLFLGYRREQVAHPLDGFGVLLPEIERRSILGALFPSTLFPGRAPAGHVALTILVGGTRQPEIARLPVDKLRATIQPDLRDLLGVNGEPVFQRHAFWPRAIPQYNLGFETHLAAIAAAEQAHPGLFIGGQARDGISLPACIASGERLADCINRP